MRSFKAPRRTVVMSVIRWYLPDALTGIALFGAVLGLLPVILAIAG